MSTIKQVVAEAVEALKTEVEWPAHLDPNEGWAEAAAATTARLLVTSKELRALGVSQNQIKKLKPVDYAGPESSARYQPEDVARIGYGDLLAKLAQLRAGELAPVAKNPKVKRPWGWDSWDDDRQIAWLKDHT